MKSNAPPPIDDIALTTTQGIMKEVRHLCDRFGFHPPWIVNNKPAFMRTPMYNLLDEDDLLRVQKSNTRWKKINSIKDSDKSLVGKVQDVCSLIVREPEHITYERLVDEIECALVDGKTTEHDILAACLESADWIADLISKEEDQVKVTSETKQKLPNDHLPFPFGDPKGRLDRVGYAFDYELSDKTKKISIGDFTKKAACFVNAVYRTESSFNAVWPIESAQQAHDIMRKEIFPIYHKWERVRASTQTNPEWDLLLKSYDTVYVFDDNSVAELWFSLHVFNKSTEAGAYGMDLEWVPSTDAIRIVSIASHKTMSVLVWHNLSSASFDTDYFREFVCSEKITKVFVDPREDLIRIKKHLTPKPKSIVDVREIMSNKFSLHGERMGKKHFYRFILNTNELKQSDHVRRFTNYSLKLDEGAIQYCASDAVSSLVFYLAVRLYDVVFADDYSSVTFNLSKLNRS